MTESEVAYPVDIETVAGAVDAGETLTVDVTVENEGSEPGETTVELAAAGDQVDTESVELDGGAAETVTFEWTPGADAVGTVELSAATGTEAATESVTVEDAPAEFTVDIDAVDEHVSVGGTITALVDVTNEGTLAGTQDIEFRVAGTVRETRRLELDGQAEETVQFTHEVTTAESPESTVRVASEHTEDETSVPVVAGTVTPLRQMGSKGGMGVFGYLVFAGMAILLLPLLPFLAVLKLVDLVTGRGDTAR